jgi:rare lipoprotein A
MKNILVLLFLVFSFSITAVAQTEYGTASYYGTYFHGRPTASGEKYNQFALTAAHKTLPLGTILKVTNAQNNKSVFVKVNDRGPYIKGRIIDLSTKAAELLGYRNKGTAYVKIEVIKPDSVPTDLVVASNADIAKENGISENPTNNKNTSKSSWASIPTVLDDEVTDKTPSTPIKNESEVDIKSDGITNRSPYFIINKLDKNNNGFYGLQLGVFSDVSIILSMIDELEAQYKQSVMIQEFMLNNKKAYKLFIGKYTNRAYADALKLTLGEKHKDAFVIKYD